MISFLISLIIDSILVFTGIYGYVPPMTHTFSIKIFVGSVMGNNAMGHIEMTEDGTREEALAAVRARIEKNRLNNPSTKLIFEVWEKVSLDSENSLP